MALGDLDLRPHAHLAQGEGDRRLARGHGVGGHPARGSSSPAPREPRAASSCAGDASRSSAEMSRVLLAVHRGEEPVRRRQAVTEARLKTIAILQHDITHAEQLRDDPMGPTVVAIGRSLTAIPAGCARGRAKITSATGRSGSPATSASRSTRCSWAGATQPPTRRTTASRKPPTSSAPTGPRAVSGCRPRV